MRRSRYFLASAATLAAAGLAACSDTTGSRQTVSPAALAAALAAVPAGYGDLTSSYVGRAAADVGDTTDFVGCDGRGGSGGGGRGERGDDGLGPGDMMGGGLGDAFLGGVGIGDGRGGHGPFGGGLPCTGTFDAASGRVSCSAVTLRNGLTVTRSASYADASGQAQQAFDSLTTNTVNLKTTVTGTITFAAPTDSAAAASYAAASYAAASYAAADSGRRGGDGGRGHGGPGGGGRGPGGGALRLLGDTARILSASTTVDNASDRTVSGLAQGSTQRTVNGTSSGVETTTGTSTRGDFTATRTVVDTVNGLVVPIGSGSATYPTAGTVVRVMGATLTYSGQSPVSISRREVVTYDGSATAQVVVTENGTTKRCTRALPRGALSCS